MPFAETRDAIGAVSRLLKQTLTAKLTNLDVNIGRPVSPSSGTAGAAGSLNLFLYEVHLDESLRNHALDEGAEAPLWLVLRYLLTAFDDDGESDTEQAHTHLGRALQALHQLNFFPRSPAPPELQDNPEFLKLTFEDSGSELLSRLMQGPDDKYRCSVSFQIRPVMIVPADPPAYSLLVGVDYTTTPPTVIGERGVHRIVLPTLGPVIASVEPERFEIGASVTITGTDIGGADMVVALGPAELPIVAQRGDQLTCTVPSVLAGGTVISAGSHPLAVVQRLSSGRRRSSNLLVGRLLPQVTSVTTSGLQRVDPPNPASPVFGDLEVDGVLLGGPDDDVVLALYANGRVVRAFDEFATVVAPPQTKLRISLTNADALPQATYQPLVRVNGQQALGAPPVVWTA